MLCSKIEHYKYELKDGSKKYNKNKSQKTNKNR